MSDEDAGDRTEDPFDRLESDGERAGDPFEELDGPASGTAPTDADAAGNDSTRDGRADQRADDPFADEDRGDGDPFEARADVFERVDADGVDPDAVWAAFADGTTGGEETPGKEETPGEADPGRYSEVSKHAYCERCEHFSTPPDASCAHGTAEIVEFLDAETVRVLNCPVVAERESLEGRE